MSDVSSHIPSGLFDIVLVKRPPRWRPKNTHEVPPRAEVVSVEMFGAHMNEAEDLLVEINSADWRDDWAIMLPHTEKRPIERKARLSFALSVTVREGGAV